MTRVTKADYAHFHKRHKSILVEGKEIVLRGRQHFNHDRLAPKEFETQPTNVWSFPTRGKWATHRGDYRGNWAPEIPRNVILRYSEEGNVVLDPMVGSGTTLVECRLLGRKGIGVDINEDAVMLAHDRLNFTIPNGLFNSKERPQALYVGDARNLDKIKSGSVDLYLTHPPYANIIKYSKNDADTIEGSLSNIKNIDAYVEALGEVAHEAFRVLKPGRVAAFLLGDTRREKRHVPICFKALETLLSVGFILKENVIKVQWNTTTKGLWANRSRQFNFLLLMYEHLFVLEKP